MGGWPIAVAAGGFWLGILAATEVGWRPTAAAGLAAIGTAVAALAALAALATRAGGWVPARPRARWGVLLALAVASVFASMGFGWGSLRQARLRASPLLSMAGRPVRVWGTLASDPVTGRFGWSATLNARAAVARTAGPVRGLRVRDAVRLEGRDRPSDARMGDRVVVEGTLVAPEGEFGRYLLNRGVVAVLEAHRVEARGPPGNPLFRAANAARSALAGSVQKVLPGPPGGLLLGLALGDTSRADPDVEEDFRATGLSHLTAVSGANVAMFLAPVLGLAMWLGFGPRARLATGLAAVAFFVVLTRAEPSVLRAGVMAVLGLWGVFLGRPRSPPAMIGGAVLILLAVDPGLVHSVGFQLSVAATAGIVTFAAPLGDRLARLPRGLALAAGTTLGAQVAVTPLLLYHFGAVPTVTLPANLLAAPLVAPAMLFGLAAAVGGALWLPLGIVLAPPAGAPLAALIGLADRLARSPLPSITSPGGRAWELVVGLAVVAGAGWWVRSGRTLGSTPVVAVVVLVPIVVWAGGLRAGPPPALTATFFDVGQGDAALVRSPGGASVLVDAGPDPDALHRKLSALGVRRLDVIVATHPHADHVAGFPAVLARFPTALVLEPGCGGESPFHHDLTRAVRSARVPVRHPRGDAVLTVGDVRLEILGPDGCYAGTASDDNNDSIVMRLSLGPSTILFPGDAEEPAQADLLRGDGDRLRAVVLKVPHHGGDTSLPSFFDAVDARVAVVSVGPNRYGHPVPEVLDELAALGMRVLRTDRLGDVTLTLRARRVYLQSSRG